MHYFILFCLSALVLNQIAMAKIKILIKGDNQDQNDNFVFKSKVGFNNPLDFFIKQNITNLSIMPDNLIYWDFV